ncbi:MAG: hypothetical protein ACJAYY_001135 [Paraglaciecola sp.]|jgi:hypothetical protein|uniref:hypothetical protein n=1 Tax=Polaribacter sp. TaxID=1920175 RepID=UPI003ACF4624
MTYKEALFFFAKCLTIDQKDKNKILVENDLKSGTINWETFVKVSSGKFVFSPCTAI